MHRQSLGSPSSKHHGHGGEKQEVVIADNEPPRRRDSPVIASLHVDYDEDEDDDNNKAPKRHRLSSPPPPAPPKPESLIHIIPVLTILCFLILYLCSHTPSQADLAHFSGFKRLSKHIDSAGELTDIEKGAYTEANKADNIVAIGSLRNLKSKRKSQLNRKFAYF